MSKKIGIITLNGYFNYGNRLQNYALQESFKKMGLEVETIRINRFINRDNFNNKILMILRYIKKTIFRRKREKANINRKQIFKKFSSTYIHETDSIYNINDDLSVLSNEYNYFVIGSDQVWNPYLNQGSSAFFAQFAEKKQRIAYSASFGLSNIPNEYKEDYIEWLNGIPHISVREDVGADIVKKYIGRDVDVLVDPTMLVSKEDWLKISKRTPNKSKNYILTYFLGGVPYEHKKQIDEIATNHNLNIINLADFDDLVTYQTGPAEFLDYINNCTLFCTDSFHGVVFSIIFEKNFIIYDRQGKQSMYSRINTLLRIFNLENRKNSNIKDSDIFETNFESTNDILINEQQKSFNFLSSAINLKDS